MKKSHSKCKCCIHAEIEHKIRVNPDPYERRKERDRIKHYRKLAAQMLKAVGIEI